MDKTDALKRIDADKRDFIAKLIATTAFAVPAVASFSMTTISEAVAGVANGSIPF